jgi:hypothetical protein
VLVELRRPDGFGCGPSLPACLRGALGHALLARTDCESNAAREILFGASPTFRARAEIPKPFVIAAEDRGAAIDVSL